jgi:hypothetical protein
MNCDEKVLRRNEETSSKTVSLCVCPLKHDLPRCCSILTFFHVTVASPLTTPEQAEHFLASMRHKSKKEEWEHRPPSNLSSDGVDAWFMMQKQREQEMRKRRQEAEQLLRGYRAPYKDDASVDTFGPWSPKSKRLKERASFGDVLSESLTDPAMPAVRRQSSTPRLQHDFSSNDNNIGRLQHNFNDNMSLGDASERTERTARSSFPPERTQFLNDKRHYDGTKYGKHNDRTSYSNGRALFNEDDNMSMASEHRQLPPPHNNHARYMIDTSESQSRLRQAGERRSYGYNENRNIIETDRDGVERRDAVEDNRSTKYKNTQFSMEGEREGREEVQSAQAPVDTPSACASSMPEIPETVWRDFISPGKDN